MPKDGNVEEMDADPVDGVPKDGGSCQSTGSGGYKAWVLAQLRPRPLLAWILEVHACRGYHPGILLSCIYCLQLCILNDQSQCRIRGME